MIDEIRAETGEFSLDLGPQEMRYIVAPIVDVDVRDPSANEDGTWTMSGYAAVFDQKTVLYDGKFVQVTEDIDPGFFDRTLREQGLDSPSGVVHFNFGHDMNRVIAATDVTPGAPGSLLLRPDARGLFYLAKASKDDHDARTLAIKLRDKVIRQSSFAFTVRDSEIRSAFDQDGRELEHRRLLDAGHLYDVCAVAQGAYAQTVSQLRSMAVALGQPIEEMGGQPRQPSDEGGVIAVSPATGGGVDLERLRAHAQCARIQLPKART